MTLAAYIPTGPLALLVSMALLGIGTLIVFAVACVWFACMERRERRRDARRREARPGYLPEKVARSYREPSNECPDTVAELLAFGDRQREQRR